MPNHPNYKVRVFVSVGSRRTHAQEAFRNAIFDELKLHGLDPHTPDQTDHTGLAPLEAVWQELERASGTLVLAFSRIQVVKGYEIAVDGQSSAPFDDRAIATPWNHVEAALAWTMKHPMLVLRENQIQPSGLLDKPMGWLDREVAVTDEPLPQEIRSTIKDWATKVHNWDAERSGTKASQGASIARRGATVANEISIRDFLGSLTVPQASTAVGALLTLLILVFGLGLSL